jgi:chromosome partitioning protein
MSHVFTLANAKGGCGKSTVALNLAICCARSGYRTLAVDLDEQGNLSAALVDRLGRRPLLLAGCLGMALGFP